MEGNGIVPNGWPLGLGNTNSRIRVVGVAAPLQPATSRHRQCYSSFSSFSSSNLDTESTMSFFRDGSVSLGKLIGIEANMHRIEGNNVCDERSHNRAGVGPVAGVPKNHTHNVRGFCAPFLHNVIGKIARSQPPQDTN